MNCLEKNDFCLSSAYKSWRKQAILKVREIYTEECIYHTTISLPEIRETLLSGI